MKDIILKSIEPVAKSLSQLELHKDPNLYGSWLAQTHYFVKHSVPLLELASVTGSDPGFVSRCMEHIREESGHDKVALSDLNQLGQSLDSKPEWEWTKSFYQRQYDLTKEKGELLLGYILALEGIAILSAPLLEPIANAYGPKASKFVKIHVEEDQEHLPEAIGQTMLLDCSRPILENFHKTLEEYQTFISKLARESAVLAA